MWKNVLHSLRGEKKNREHFHHSTPFKMTPGTQTQNQIHHDPNGLTLIAEAMPWCESVSCSILVPCGSNDDPPERLGLSNLTCEMALRGAGQYGSRPLIEAFENLGVDRSESLGNMHTTYSVATLSENLPLILPVMADILRRPHFPAGQLDAGKLVIEQEIISVEDDPAGKVMQELTRIHLPAPWGLPCHGTLDSLAAITIDEIRKHHARRYQPDGMIISVAGKIHWPQLVEQFGELFGDWPVQERPAVIETPVTTRTLHIPYDSAQTHIGVAFDEVPFRDPDYLPAWGAVGILSGGMSSRLFTEVREKRGLCYSVGASYYSLRDRGGVTCYCGTSAERAQESLDVLLAELRRLRKGVTEKEVELLKIRAKSQLVMQQESTGSRASSIARDWYHLGRIRPMSEIMEKIDALDKTAIDAFLARSPERPLTLVTLGPEPFVLDDVLKIEQLR
ncbi:MAG: insulinase family protein [Planctomycetaceae bacterium]|nr:insulinase family protein [Planctomycetaceae bacterium]